MVSLVRGLSAANTDTEGFQREPRQVKCQAAPEPAGIDGFAGNALPTQQRGGISSRGPIRAGTGGQNHRKIAGDTRQV